MIFFQMRKQTNRSIESTGDITEVDWEVEIQEPEAHMSQLNENYYAALAGD